MKNIFLIVICCWWAIMLQAQKVFIDQPVRVGDIIVFPSVDNPNVYYYLPNKPRVAIGKDNKPQFSFLLFTEKNRSEVSAEDIEDQIGGGVVHALVTYGLTNAQVRATAEGLKEVNSDAILKGPIIFKSGNIAMVSAIADPNGEYTKKIVGLGNAPIMEGNKAAVAFMLETEGAKLLWSTFKTSTPDVSFSFEMEMAGYLTPIKGYLKGKLEQVYEAHEFTLGGSGSSGAITFGAEIGATFDKLRRDGTIETYVEGEDEEMEKLIFFGYKKLADMIFEPLGQSYSQMVNNDPSKAKSGIETLTDLENFSKMQKANRSKGQEKAEEPDIPKASKKGKNKNAGSTSINKNNTESKNRPVKPKTTQEKRDSVKRARERRRQGRNRNIVAPSPANNRGPNGIDDYDIPYIVEIPEESVAGPTAPFSAYATYRFRQTKLSGNFNINLNKVSADTRFMRFDENIGDIKRKCQSCFKVVSLDEMYEFKQREVRVILDGQLLSNFKQFVNYASIRLRKKHPNGKHEYETARVDYANFKGNGNVRKLVYGWQNDPIESWLDYEYKVDWSFFGGYEIKGNWQKSDASAIALSPPLTLKTVMIDANPDLADRNGIENIYVKLYYDYGAGKRSGYYLESDVGKKYIPSSPIRLGKHNGLYGEHVNIILPKDSEQVKYQYIVTNEQGEKFKSKIKDIEFLTILDVDRIPKK